jgi:hypothetical protein
MTKWQDIFFIKQTMKNIGAETFEISLRISYIVCYKATNERVNKRYYSSEIDARRGAAMLFKSYQKKIEKELLGQ